MITPETREAVWRRAGGRCENPECLKPFPIDGDGWEVHHNNWKSQYKGTDRDEAWNLSMLCDEKCHKTGKKAVHNGNVILDKYLKARSERMKPTRERSFGKAPELLRAKEIRKSAYKNQLQKFKDAHGGLSPFQYNYKKNKLKKTY